MSGMRKIAAFLGILAFFALWGVLVVRYLENRQGACAQPPPQPAEDHADHNHGTTCGGADEEPGKWSLYGIQVAEARSAALRKELRLMGEIVRNEDRVAAVVPRAVGIVREVARSTGETVAADDLLAVMDSVEIGEAKVDFLDRRRTLDLAELDFRRAQAVRAGTVEVLQALAANPLPEDLAHLNGGEMGEDRGRILSAYAERAAARREHQREETLIAKQIGTETDLVAAGNARHQAEAAYDALRDSLEFGSRRGLQDAERQRDNAAFALAAARRRLAFLGVPEGEIRRLEQGTPKSLVAEELARVELRAPISGRIVARTMTPGQKLSAGDIVFTIANDTTVWANLTVHARDLPAIRTGTPATIQSSFRDGATTGQIALILPHIDEDTRTATARVVLDNPDGRWQPGMFVTARLELPPETAAIAVPKAAVQTVEGEAVVFIPHGGEFETQVVQTGRSDRDQIEIIAGLRPGDAFVAAGAFELKARMLTSNLDPHAGHGH